MKIEYNHGILFVRLNGSLDRSLSKIINQELVPKILEQKIKYLVFNLYNVDNLDEYGLDAILNTKCAIRSNKGKICICELSDKLNKKIKLINLKKVENEVSAINMMGEI